MCGRYVSVAESGDLMDEFDAVDNVGDEVAPSWNVAPTDPVRIVVERGAPAPVRQLRTVQWGLLPGWSRDRRGAAKMINARSETVGSKPAFKTAAARRRCLVPALGYYEWQTGESGKTAYFLHQTDDRLLAMAGLYELWRDRSLADDDPQRWVWTCTIITRAATDALGAIHERCPILVPTDVRAAWLDCTSDDAAVATRLLDAMPEPHLQSRIVSPAVGNVRNNGPELIEPADDRDPLDLDAPSPKAD